MFCGVPRVSAGFALVWKRRRAWLKATNAAAMNSQA